MAEQIDFSADFVQVEDITDRVEELREAQDEAHGGDCAQRLHSAAECTCGKADEAVELQMLEDALDNLRGYGGNHQWEGDWYPQTLIAERAFEGAMDDLIDDIGELPKDLPSYLKVSIDYDALRTDYTGDSFGGYDFLFR